MKHRNARAFSLLDLVGAIACALLAATVLYPVLKSNRTVSTGVGSRAQLKLLIRAHASYTIAHQDRWLNPFNPTTTYNGIPNTADPEWYSIKVPNQPGFVWRMDDPGYQTEMYSMHWASAASDEMLGGNPLSPLQFDPQDSQLITSFQLLASAPGFPDNTIWPSSYMYSPSMWFNAARYAGSARLTPAAPNQAGGVRSVRYNTTGETTYPSQKVVLFQRADFDLASRTGANGQPVPLSPQWNNPAAVPDAAFADGSVDEVCIRKVQIAIDAGSDWLAPTTPSWNLPTALLTNYDLGTSWENGQNNTTAWQAFFWGTRGGVGGRDVARR